MKRTLSFMVMALALLLTQCRKPEVKFPSPVAPEGTTVSMTVTAGPDSKTDITTAGAITWSSGDKLYVGYNGAYVGYLTLTSGQNTPTGWFSGNVTLPNGTTGEQPFRFFYLGSAERTLTVGATTVDVDFSSQNIYAEDGKLKNASAQHVGYGSASGTVKDGVVTGINVMLVSKVAIAYFYFKDGTTPYTDALTLSGEHIYNKMTVNFSASDFSFDVTQGDIRLSGGNGERYVMLVPSGTTEEVLNFGGDDGAKGTTTLENGIEANKFYRMPDDGSAIKVDIKIPAYFSVAADRKVKFSRGNLYYDNGWHFEANQYDFRTLNNHPRCINGVYGASSGTDVGRGIFGWSTNGAGCNYGMYNSATEIDGDFVEWGNNTIDGENGYRTLTSWSDPKGEWDYLMSEREGKYNGADASAADLFGYATITVEGGSVKGLILLPDMFKLPDGVSFVPSSTTGFTANEYDKDKWSKMEEAGAVFLPQTGYYNQAFGGSYQSSQTRYWSSTKYDNPSSPSNVYAKNLLINDPGSISFSFGKVNNSYAVRLVVDVTD